MPLPPNTTPVPRAIFLPGMSHKGEAPTPTSTPTPTPVPVPVRPKDGDSSTDSKRRENVKLPRLRLHIEDLAHRGTAIFLNAINASSGTQSCVEAVQTQLYTGPSAESGPTTHLPSTRSVTLILQDMDGVAYTTGTDLDPEHKEIHFSLRYIASIPSSLQTREITGVLTHELVHCYQWNGRGAAPSGLIEGVADWVRLQCGLAPPHWRREPGSRWDAGYQTTAYFLEYLEARFGKGTVRRLNEGLRTEKYDENRFWSDLLGWPIERLWDDYKKKLDEEKKGSSDQAQAQAATAAAAAAAAATGGTSAGSSSHRGPKSSGGEQEQEELQTDEEENGSEAVKRVPKA
ncbi:peptidase of plants and bacteria-domain-containing protein [Xylariomycetidae sp. FL2044]|nr:peptidase of plants and bacteria-domain-containing protein [Xylariomycetidae sp. FL2044]